MTLQPGIIAARTETTRGDDEAHIVLSVATLMGGVLELHYPVHTFGALLENLTNVYEKAKEANNSG